VDLVVGARVNSYQLFFVELIYHHKVGRGPFLWRTRWWFGQYDMPALFERLATESKKFILLIPVASILLPKA
jgi:hypothetical protein